MVEVREPTHAEIDVEVAEARAALTERERAWAEAYVGQARFVGRQASIIAGVSPKQGHRYKMSANVQRYVQAMLADGAKRWLVTKSRVMEEIVSLAFSDISGIMDFDGSTFRVKDLSTLPRNVAAAISHIKLRRQKVVGSEEGEWEEVLEVKFHDKLKALGWLAEAYGIGQNPDDDEEMIGWAGVEILAPAEEDERG